MMKKKISLIIILCITVCAVIGIFNASSNHVDGHYVAKNHKLPEYLMLINAWNEIDEDYEFEPVTLNNGEIINELIYPDLQNMFNDARAVGVDPEVVSGYRSAETQQQWLDERINEYIRQGYSDEQAEEMAKEWVAMPGHSEHQTGLAVDVNARNGSSDKVYEWLKNNCWKYGFILRYPQDKTEITGINYEPWHFRYVGYEAAQYINEHNITFEEYLENVY